MPSAVEPAVDLSDMVAFPQPTVRVDDAISLRPFDSADAPAVLRGYQDPDIVHWHGFRLDDHDEALGWIATCDELWSEGKAVVWAITDGGTMLGRCALHFDQRAGNAEVAYWVLPEARGGRIATRAAIAATKWAHEVAGFHRVFIEHAVENPASRAVAAHAGFVSEGIARGAAVLDDGRHDVHRHAHLATD